MERMPLRVLLESPAAPDRIFYYRLWFKGHNNPRYSELLPRLERLDRFLVPISDRRVIRSAQYRTFRATRRIHNPIVGKLGGRRYRNMFTVDNELIPLFRGAVVSDNDDPKFTPSEVSLLNRPNVAAYVVTAERAAREYERLGVEKPWHVIPQGFSSASVSPERVESIARALQKDGLVVGYMAAWLLSAGDRDGGDPLYNIDHLLELWDEIRARVPDATLWLIGGASERVRERVRERGDIRLLGRLPRDEALNTAASFDVALYPRTEDQGIRSSKVGEYIGLGLPTVSYDYKVTDELRETGAGVLVATPADFVNAVVELATHSDLRLGIAANARKAGAARDWDVLARDYALLFDRYLPPSSASR
jgi:glycosyltransferase involved in cell wall biosynthesis